MRAMYEVSFVVPEEVDDREVNGRGLREALRKLSDDWVARYSGDKVYYNCTVYGDVYEDDYDLEFDSCDLFDVIYDYSDDDVPVNWNCEGIY